MAEKVLEKKQAIDIIQESVRDYLKLNVTLPLGNTALKKVHADQFCFIDLPTTFQLENWDKIAEVLSSAYSRYQGYEVGRWYIEEVTIDVEAVGKCQMQLALNPFPTTRGGYQVTYRDFIDRWKQAFKDNTESTTSNKNNNKSNAVNKNNTKLFPTKAGKNVSTDLTKAAKQITKDCNTEEQRAYCIYDWVDKYVKYQFYSGYKYSSSQVLSGKKANCWDTAFLIYNLCSKCKPKVRCEIYNGYYHFLDGTYGHLWNRLPYKGKMTFADTGRDNRNPIGSHGGKGRYIVSGGNSPYRKNY